MKHAAIIDNFLSSVKREDFTLDDVAVLYEQYASMRDATSVDNHSESDLFTVSLDDHQLGDIFLQSDTSPELARLLLYADGVVVKDPILDILHSFYRLLDYGPIGFHLNDRIKAVNWFDPPKVIYNALEIARHSLNSYERAIDSGAMIISGSSHVYEELPPITKYHQDRIGEYSKPVFRLWGRERGKGSISNRPILSADGYSKEVKSLLSDFRKDSRLWELIEKQRNTIWPNDGETVSYSNQLMRIESALAERVLPSCLNAWATTSNYIALDRESWFLSNYVNCGAFSSSVPRDISILYALRMLEVPSITSDIYNVISARDNEEGFDSFRSKLRTAMSTIQSFAYDDNFAINAEQALDDYLNPEIDRLHAQASDRRLKSVVKEGALTFAVSTAGSLITLAKTGISPPTLNAILAILAGTGTASFLTTVLNWERLNSSGSKYDRFLLGITEK
ncbi:MAG: hypothetical protein JAZ19_12075 [Candidatus Thiodiazotropha taylori]|nr:hypothetical protein [Candidatus Thiodiazotropha taylori]